ncbi:MAG: hypothetical protein E7050_10155 [Lentisphaerae bacterium]|nr:hypothetical protein [Lentisphaerota bacterium]
MIGKILFIDDECQRLQSGEPHIITNTVSKLVKDGKLEYTQCEIAESFADAVKKIINVKNGNDYSWIFIDRNLEKFADIKNAKEKSVVVEIEVDDIKIKFDNRFFESLAGFEGDYLYFLLRKNSVPLEKICFLTANDPKSNGENSGLKTSHLVFDKDIPQTIEKEKESVQSSIGGDDDE